MNQSLTDDDYVVRGQKRGVNLNAKEVEQLIDDFGMDVYRFCSKLCGNKPDAEDLYQQTFLRVVEIDMSIKWDENPKAFLFSVTNSIWKNSIRKQARHNRIAPSIAIEDNNEILIADNTNIEEEVFSKMRNDKLHEIIQSLPDKFRILITLYYSFNTPFKEMARIEKIPIGTVKSRLYKGRSLIKKRLEELGYEYE